MDPPVLGLLDLVQHGYWHPLWGTRPTDPGEALTAAEKRIASAPRLVPVYGHRFLPSGRGTCCHPVLSVVGSDIIVYGRDLADYLQHEFARDRFRGTHDVAATTGPSTPLSLPCCRSNT